MPLALGMSKLAVYIICPLFTANQEEDSPIKLTRNKIKTDSYICVFFEKRVSLLHETSVTDKKRYEKADS